MSIKTFFKKKRNRNLIYVVGPVSFFAIYAISIATEDRHGVVKHSDLLYHEVEKVEIEKWMAKYEELEWFATAEVIDKALYEMPSKMIFGKSIPPFDRILLRLKILDTILTGRYEDYLDLVKEQTKEMRLEWNQFQDLQNHMRTVIEGNKKLSPELVREAVEFAIVVGEIGETQTARNKAWVYEIVTNDTRTFIERVMEMHPEMLPSYSKLKPEQQRIVKTILTLVRFQEIADLRAGEETFERIKKSKILEEEPELFELALLVFACEIAGSLGDYCFCSSPWFTKYACQDVNSIRKAFYLLKEKSAKEAAQYYLGERSGCLDLDPGSPFNRVLARIGAMLKLYTPAEGKILKETFLKFQPHELATIVAQFDVNRPKEETIRISGLNVLFLVLRTQGHLGVSEKDKLSQSVLIAFPFIARVLKERSVASKNVPELKFHKIIPIVMHDASLLKEGKITIENNGMVTVTRPVSM